MSADEKDNTETRKRIDLTENKVPRRVFEFTTVDNRKLS